MTSLDGHVVKGFETRRMLSLWNAKQKTKKKQKHGGASKITQAKVENECGKHQIRRRNRTERSLDRSVGFSLFLI